MDAKVYPLEFLCDGKCRICLFDVARLRKSDRHGRLVFVDVAAADFDAAPYGRTRAALLARTHGRHADDAVVEGPEVFRLALAAVGWAWAVTPTRWPILRHAAEAAYRWFARNRMELSRRYGGFFALLTPACDANICQR
jgi:predicted DCC family thiol-disulfide oxidoreductase YuxK